MEIDWVVWRLVHLFAGAYWIGVALFSVLFLTPVVRRTGPDGQSVMRELIGKTWFPYSMAGAGALAVGSGAVLYWQVSGRLSGAWITSGPGMALTAGAVAGVAGWLVSELVQARSSVQMARIGRAIEAGGAAPMPEQLEAMRLHQARIMLGAKVTSLLLIVALFGMAVWRYIH